MGPSLKAEVFTSSLWMVGWQGGARFLGLISTVILARLLEPGDFGILAIAMLVVGLVETLTLFGTDRYLISKSNPSVDEYNSAWTLNLIQFGIVGCALFVFSSSVAQYFNDQRIANVIKVLSITVIMNGFRNIGIVILKKNLIFSKIFISGLVEKLVGFVTTVTIAIVLRNYWAMVIGTLCMRITDVSLSYYLHPYRPKLCLKEIRKLLSFSKWIISGNIALYIRNKLDQLIISKFFSVDKIGVYSMASDIANIPTKELATPLYQTIFSGFGKLVDDKHALGNAFLTTNGAFACIMFPLAAGLAVTAKNIVILLLSEKWLTITPYLPWLLLMGACIALSGVSRDVLVVLKKVKLVSHINWAVVVILIPSLLYTAKYNSMLYLIIVRAAIALCVIILFWLVAAKALKLPFTRIIQSIIRPGLAVTFMTVCLLFFCPTWEHNRLLTLSVQVPVGAITYCGALYFLWRNSGKPNCGEQILFELIKENYSMMKSKIKKI